MRTSYPEELTAQGLAEQRKARMAAILDFPLPSEPDDFEVPDRFYAIAGLREIAAEFS